MNAPRTINPILTVAQTGKSKDQTTLDLIRAAAINEADSELGLLLDNICTCLNKNRRYRSEDEAAMDAAFDVVTLAESLSAEWTGEAEYNMEQECRA